MNRQLKSTPVEKEANLMPFKWRNRLASWNMVVVIGVFSIDYSF